MNKFINNYGDEFDMLMIAFQVLGFFTTLAFLWGWLGVFGAITWAALMYVYVRRFMFHM